MTKPAPVTTVTGPHDPDKPTGPVEPTSNVDDPDYLEMQTIALYLTEREEVLKVGTELVKAALEVYVEVAKIPFYELGAEVGGAGLAEAIGKVGEFTKQVAELRKFETEATQAAIEARRLAQEGRNAGKSAEEVAKAEELATKADQQAKEADELANEGDQFLARSQEKIRRANDIQGWRQHLKASDLEAARDELNGIDLYKTGGDPYQHLKEVRESQGGVFDRIQAINQGLANPNLSRENFADLTEELGVLSKLLDATEQYVPRP